MIFTVCKTSRCDPGPEHQPCPLTTWDADKKAWVIEIKTLDTLTSFQKAVGESVILRGTTLEIYDYWRE